MRIHRLIPIVVVLFILAATTMTTVQHRSGRRGIRHSLSAASNQAEPVQSDGTSSVVASETTSGRETPICTSTPMKWRNVPRKSKHR